MIRVCTLADSDRIYHIINEAAKAYDGVIPSDCYHQPYMPMQELLGEMKRMTFYGWEEHGEMVGVMASEPVKELTLIRHAYVLTEHQKKGIGGRLLLHIKSLTRTRRLLVGTWAANWWGIALYEKHGFKMLPDKDALLKAYWDIPPRQIETSVVLGLYLE